MELFEVHNMPVNVAIIPQKLRKHVMLRRLWHSFRHPTVRFATVFAWDPVNQEEGEKDFAKIFKNILGAVAPNYCIIVNPARSYIFAGRTITAYKYLLATNYGKYLISA